jgi:hypothetical protein
VPDSRLMVKPKTSLHWRSRQAVACAIGLCGTQACMQVQNGAPVTAQTAAYRGTGTTSVTIETDLPVQRIDEVRRDSRTYWVTTTDHYWKNGVLMERIRQEQVTETSTTFVGPTLCARHQSPCTIGLARGPRLIAVRSDLLNSPAVTIAVEDKPLKLRVVEQKNAFVGGTGFFLMGLGGAIAVLGAVQAASGQPRPEEYSRDDMVGRGLVLAGAGLALVGGGYLLTLSWTPGKLTIAPTDSRR